MKTFSVCMSIILLSGCVSSQNGSNWQCSANGMINSSYSGGNTAMIHLSGYSRGGHYKVSKNEAGTVATGNTGNGTPFVCKKVN